MSNKNILTLLPVILLAFILTGCAADEPMEILPVTVVPPVSYPPTQAPILPPTSMPTSVPFATPTPYREVNQQEVPEVRAGEVDDNER